MTQDYYTNELLSHLRRLKYYTLFDIVLQRLVIMALLISTLYFMSAMPYFYLLTFIIALFPSRHGDELKLGRHFDQRYRCEEIIASACYLQQQSKTSTFHSVITQHALQQLQHHFPSELQRFRNIYLQKILYLVTIILFTCTMSFSPNQLTSDQK